MSTAKTLDIYLSKDSELIYELVVHLFKQLYALYWLYSYYYKHNIERQDPNLDVYKASEIHTYFYSKTHFPQIQCFEN